MDDCDLDECQKVGEVVVGGYGLPDDMVGLSVVQGTRDGVCVDKIYAGYNNGQISVTYSDGGTGLLACDGTDLPWECGGEDKEYGHEIRFRCAEDGTEVMLEFSREDGIPQPTVYTNTTTATPWTGDPLTLTKCDDVEREGELVPICIGGTDAGRAVVPLENGVHLDPIAFKDSKLVTIPEPTDRDGGFCIIDDTVNIISAETVSGSGALVFNKPADACYAVGQVLEGTIIMTVDGSAPVENSNGYHEGCKFVIESCEEMGAFQAIGSAANPPKIYITYYDGVIDVGGF